MSLRERNYSNNSNKVMEKKIIMRMTYQTTMINNDHLREKVEGQASQEGIQAQAHQVRQVEMAVVIITTMTKSQGMDMHTLAC